MTEAQEQEAVIRWCDWSRIPVYHIPNGGKRNVAEAAHLKRLGVRAGVPDLCIPVARGRYHSLYVEMKAGRGKPTEKQVEWIERLGRLGHCAIVCNGSEQAIDDIRRYMLLPPNGEF